MEYVRGRSLRERVDEGALPVDEAVRLGIQAATPSRTRTTHGVIHRDFKAANVIVGEDGWLKVVDFGLARRDDAWLADATTAGVVGADGRARGHAIRDGARTGARRAGRCAHRCLGAWRAAVRDGDGREAVRRPDGSGTVLVDSHCAAGDAAVDGPHRVARRHRAMSGEGSRAPLSGAQDVRIALEAIAAGTVAPWRSWRYHLRRRPIFASAAVTRRHDRRRWWDSTSRGVRDRLIGRPSAEPAIKLAVLPFQNLTGDPDQEYFSDGLTDEMITQLGRLHPQRLSVIARTSSMRYKRGDVPIDQIGRELGVDYIMEGSARREGSRVRISATLIQVRDQTQRWSDSFERELASILTLQSDVAGGVARALALTLLPAEQNRLASARRVDPEAYEAYLRGRFHWQTMGPEGLAAAMSYFQLAVQKDPNYAAPYTGMGAVWGLRCNSGVMPCPEALPKWKAAIRKARDLEPNLPEVQAHVAAMAFYVDWDWASAEREFQRAVSLDPAFPDTHMWYGEFLTSLGRFDEGIAEARRAADLDPHNSLYQFLVGRGLLMARRDDEAIAVMQDVLKRDPARRNAQVQLGIAFARKGRHEESFALMKRNNPNLADVLTRAYAEGGYQRAARVRADVAAAQSRDAFGVAGFYARAGERALTLDWLEKGYEQRGPGIVHLRVDPTWDALRDEPRFQALMQRLKFPTN